MNHLLTLIHVSDMHFGHPSPMTAEVKDWWCKFPALSGYFGHCGRALRYLEETIATLRAQEPDTLLLVTGDLTAYASDEQFALARAFLEDRATFSHGRTLGLRFGRESTLMIPGNHDHWSGREAQNLFDFVMYGGPTATFTRTFPQMPLLHLERPLGKGRKLVMVGIDSDADLKPSSPGRLLARGSFVGQLRQAEDLFDGDPETEVRVLVLHHSRMNQEFVCGIEGKSQAALDEFIRRHRISVLLTGHTHVCRTEGETIRTQERKWWLLESRCGTTSQRSLEPLGCAKMKLQPNSFLVHRLYEADDGAVEWRIEEFVRGPWTPFSSDGTRPLRYRLMP